MNEFAELTKRESEIAELFAWGASKRHCHPTLYFGTDGGNHTETYTKRSGAKVNELSAWWFCTNFHISFDLSPFKRNVITIILLVLMIPQMIDFDNTAIRIRNTTCRTVRVRARRKIRNDFPKVNFTM